MLNLRTEDAPDGPESQGRRGKGLFDRPVTGFWRERTAELLQG